MATTHLIGSSAKHARETSMITNEIACATLEMKSEAIRSDQPSRVDTKSGNLLLHGMLNDCTELVFREPRALRRSIPYIDHGGLRCISCQG